VPPQNPIGFGISDFIELALAALLLLMAMVARPWIEPFARKLAPRTPWCMLLLALLPIALRLAMLPQHPAPSPVVYDEFGHLLVADTLLHFRFANPPHPLHQFFETFFVLQTPSYSSIYPIGQGLMLAIGRAIFGLPWAGVLLSTAAMCSLCYWMLRGWTTPGWALLGRIGRRDRRLPCIRRAAEASRGGSSAPQRFVGRSPGIGDWHSLALSSV